MLTKIIAYLKPERDFPGRISGYCRKPNNDSVNIEEISHKYKKNWVL